MQTTMMVNRRQNTYLTFTVSMASLLIASAAFAATEGATLAPAHAPCHIGTTNKGPYTISCANCICQIDCDTCELCCTWVDVIKDDCYDWSDDGSPTSWWCTSGTTYTVCLDQTQAGCSWVNHTWGCSGLLGLSGTPVEKTSTGTGSYKSIYLHSP